MKKLIQIFCLLFALTHSYADNFIPTLVQDKKVINHFNEILPGLKEVYTTPIRNIYVFKVNKCIIFGDIYSNYLLAGEMLKVGDHGFALSEHIPFKDNYKFKPNTFKILPSFEAKQNFDANLNKYFHDKYKNEVFSGIGDTPFKDIIAIRLDSKKLTIFQDINNQEYAMTGIFDSQLIYNGLTGNDN